MSKVDIIIPIHNIASRQHKRVVYSLMTLVQQKDKIGKVYIADSSRMAEFKALGNMIKGFDFVEHFSAPNEVFNKPLLYSLALKRGDSEYVFLTDCDYLFSVDLLEHLERLRSDKRMIFKKVLNIPRQSVGENIIKNWSFKGKKPHAWGTFANGALQYATREFFEMAIIMVPQYLQMEGWGAMDNLMAYIATKYGLEIHWMQEGEILHQFHVILKYRTSVDKIKFDKNQQILHDYIHSNGLPHLLSKDG